jgi:hypothetical protein
MDGENGTHEDEADEVLALLPADVDFEDGQGGSESEAGKKGTAVHNQCSGQIKKFAKQPRCPKQQNRQMNGQQALKTICHS